MKYRIIRITYYYHDKRKPTTEWPDLPVSSIRKYRRQLRDEHPEVSGIELAYETCELTSFNSSGEPINH